MNKTDLVNMVAQKTQLTKRDSERAVAAIFSTISQALAEGEKVQLIGFGNFEIRERAARTGRNPHTGETIEITAAKVPTFKAGTALKGLVNGKKD